MLGTSWKYRGLDFTSAVQIASQQSNGFSYVLQDVQMDVPLRTNTYDNSNFHGGYSSNTLAGQRLFTFTGKVVGTTKAQRDNGWKEISQYLLPSGNPNATNRGFYDLTWKTDGGENRTVRAKVYSMPKPSNGLDDPIIEFIFELYSETERFYGDTEYLITGNVAYFGGQTLWTTLSTQLNNYVGAIPLTNNGNWIAPCKIQIIGTATNPQIINTANGNKLRINGTTDNLVIDNRNLDNDPLKTFIITDNGDDIKYKRGSGADIFLESGLNNIVVVTDNPEESPIIYITFRNTYI